MTALPAPSTEEPPRASDRAPVRARPAASGDPQQVARRPYRGGWRLFAAVVVVVALIALAVVLAAPATAVFVAPVGVIIVAASLWRFSRTEVTRLQRTTDALRAEKRELSDSLERMADTAWELRESEERYRNLIDAQGDLVVHRDAEGRVTFANPAYLDAFGIAMKDMIGAPLSQTPLEGALPTGIAATHGDVETRDVKLMTESGPRWFSWVDIQIRDEAGTIGPVYSVARDITARKEIELAQVGARRKAEAASQSKSRFLATVSHEFRTPLNGILGLTGLLLETPLTPVQETYARGVQSSGNALLGLIDDMLDFSKIEAGRIDLRPGPTDLETLLQDIVELLAARAHAKGIDIVADIDPALPERVSVDATRLRQVLVNLVANGIKFTERGGLRIAAECEAIDGDRATVAFSVSDSGPGIAAGDAERLFGEFEQADSAPDRIHGGVGLGLAISRRIVRHMESDLSVAPREGGGSVFRFVLELPVDKPPRSAGPGMDGRRILIVMPDGAEAPVLVRAVERAGAEARHVDTLRAATALMAAATAAGLSYDAVLIGRSLICDLASAHDDLMEAAGCPIGTVLLIEPGDRPEIGALRQAGFDAYLVRPIRRSSLLRIVGHTDTETGAFRADREDEQTTAGPATQPRSGLEVLLAEDNEVSALLARAVLEGLGHTVMDAADGAAAIAAVTGRSVPFALILMDLHMPGVDGMAAARAIRRHEAESGAGRTKIVALTADVLPETEEEARGAGIDLVLSKPVSPESLRRLLENANETKP